jgi:hypothetical protein
LLASAKVGNAVHTEGAHGKLEVILGPEGAHGKLEEILGPEGAMEVTFDVEIVTTRVIRAIVGTIRVTRITIGTTRITRVAIGTDYEVVAMDVDQAVAKKTEEVAMEIFSFAMDKEMVTTIIIIMTKIRITITATTTPIT